MKNKGKRHCTLCYYCAKATTGGCSWSKKFIPVEGWKAKPTILDGGRTHSFEVFRCPEFVEHELCKTDARWQKELIDCLSFKEDQYGSQNGYSRKN